MTKEFELRQGKHFVKARLAEFDMCPHEGSPGWRLEERDMLNHLHLFSSNECNSV
jgi:hypothetical protein